MRKLEDIGWDGAEIGDELQVVVVSLTKQADRLSRLITEVSDLPAPEGREEHKAETIKVWRRTLMDINECLTALDNYALRSFGIGERSLPGSTNTRGGSPINMCNITVLIGSGMLRNILFGAVSLSTGFFLALSLALLKARDEWFLSTPG